MYGRTLVFALIGLSACAHQPRPEGPDESALYRDLERLVSVQASAGWKIDRFEQRSLLPDALLSVCSTPKETRNRVRRWLDRRIDDLGGPVEAQYILRGKDLGEMDDALLASRIRDLLVLASESADEDCPFWLEQEAPFEGLQIADNRFILSFGGGGKLILLDEGGIYDVSFGGAGRALLGRGLGEHWALFVGAETGGSASFPRSEEGGERESLVLAFDVVTPLVVRYRLVNTFFEFEGGWLGHFTEDDDWNLDHGIHVGLTGGLLATKKLWFFPGAAFGVSYERTFPKDGRSVQNSLKLGFRVVLDILL